MRAQNIFIPNNNYNGATATILSYLGLSCSPFWPVIINLCDETHFEKEIIIYLFYHGYFNDYSFYKWLFPKHNSYSTESIYYCLSPSPQHPQMAGPELSHGIFF